MRENNSKELSFLSVVIIGLNEEKNIEACIKSIEKATVDIPKTEIVYVDSGSTDQTIPIALQNGVKVFQLGKKQSPSPAAGRYVGDVVTEGKYIMFVDGDSFIIPGWVKPAIELLESDNSIAMFGGRYMAFDIGTTLSPPCEQKGTGVVKPVHKLGGGCIIMTRNALESAGNWNPFIKSGEEEELAIRIHHKLPDRKILMSDQYTSYGYWCKNLTFTEIIRRWKRGFFKGPGQTFRNAVAYGYWRQALQFAKPSINVIIMLISILISLFLKYGYVFLISYFLFLYLRAMLHKRKLFVFYVILHSFLSGAGFILEFINSKPKISADYIRDFREISK